MLTTTEVSHAIEDFIAERLQTKLDAAKTEDERESMCLAYTVQNRLKDMARRAGWITLATHCPKFTHPDSRASSVFSKGNQSAGDGLVGTHSLRSIESDAVGNAAALDVYAFLSCKVGDKTIFDLAVERDDALVSAVAKHCDDAEVVIGAFASVADAPSTLSAHALMKQVYWGDKLLGVLYPSSFVHQVYQTLQEHRFSESAKEVREAKKKAKAHDGTLRTYPALAVTYFCKGNPQVISNLNSKRNGRAFLLHASPPKWVSTKVRPIFGFPTMFGKPLLYHGRMRFLVSSLNKFLKKVKHHDNFRIRNKRAEYVDEIITELLHFVASVQQVPPGWSQDPKCRLNAAEKRWLDPKGAPDAAGWRDMICERFANWLNARLDSDETKMGKAEFDAWKKELKEYLDDE